jgi:hypothetical protein
MKIGVVSLLTIVFVTLKLCHVIEWSWLWVLGPLWIPVVAMLAMAFGVAAIVVILGVLIPKSWKKKIRTWAKKED